MFDANKVNWEKIRKPASLFEVIKYDEANPIEFYKKVVKLKKMLRDKYLYVSDELRSDEALDDIIRSFFLGQTLNIPYELGDFQGILVFVNIIPEFKANLIFKIWDKKLWGKKFLKEAKKVLDLVMDEFGLQRVATSSPDKRMIKLAEMAGFKLEGEHPKSFRWNRKLYTSYTLGKTKEK